MEAEVLPACRELGIGFVAYSPLGRGFLTGRFQDGKGFEEGDFRAGMPRFSAENVATNRLLVDVIAERAIRKHCTSAQVALAWLLAQGDDIVPIPGTKQRRYLEENAAAASIELSAEELADLDRAIARLPVAGARYSAEGMKGVDA